MSLHYKEISIQEAFKQSSSSTSLSNEAIVLVVASNPQELHHLNHILVTYEFFRNFRIKSIVAFKSKADQGLSDNNLKSNFTKKRNRLHIRRFTAITLLRDFIEPIALYLQAWRLLRSTKYDIILCGSDVNPRSIATYVVHFATQQKKTTLVSPFCLSNHEEHIFAARKNGLSRTIKSNMITRFLKILYGPWIREVDVDKRQIIFYKYFISGRFIEFFRVFRGNPWIPCGGKSKFILLESAFECDYYSRCISEVSKIRLLAPCKHALQSWKASKNRNSNLQITGSQTDKMPHLLWSPLPDFLESNYFRNYTDYLIWHLKALASFKCKVLISLHPRASRESIMECIATIKAANTFTILECHLTQSMSSADLFICTNSSAIKYALMSHKPVLNFDFADQGYTEYLNINPVYYAKTPQEFVNYLQALFLDQQKVITQLSSGFSEFPDEYFGLVT